jgi:hypothetical protein
MPRESGDLRPVVGDDGLAQRAVAVAGLADVGEVGDQIAHRATEGALQVAEGGRRVFDGIV